MLEELLEHSKPAYPESAAHFHYLLKTPFRYPPLPWGSRFGQHREAGILYGGCSVHSTLAEAAFYRFVFWHSMSALPVKHTIQSQHTLLSAGYLTDRGIQLQRPHFDEFADVLTHSGDYQATNQLGTAMRSADIQAFEYQSARDADMGLCVGLLNPAALKDGRPQETSPYLCALTSADVSFKSLRSGSLYHFAINSFLVEGKLPFPP